MLKCGLNRLCVCVRVRVCVLTQTWRAQAQMSEATSKQMEEDLHSTKRRITELNQERKLSQMAAGGLVLMIHARLHGNAGRGCCRVMGLLIIYQTVPKIKYPSVSCVHNMLLTRFCFMCAQHAQVYSLFMFAYCMHACGIVCQCFMISLCWYIRRAVHTVYTHRIRPYIW
jgi:hypothetical protein